MFKCSKCCKTSEPQEKQYRIVAETRRVAYPRREYRVGGKRIIDPGGSGIEIAKEHKLCTKCVTEVAPHLLE